MSQVKVPAGLVSSEGPPLRMQTTTFPPCPHMTGRENKLSGLSSRKDTNPMGSEPHLYGLI